MSLNIIHITNDYNGSEVYKNLFNSIDKYGITQFVYHPTRIKNKKSNPEIQYFNNIVSKIYIRPILDIYTRVNYFAKIRRIFKSIQEEIRFDEQSIIHAHTWYSDGGVAYEIFKKFGTPYIITIRSTDLVIFFKYLIHLRTYGINILKNASKIVFLTPAYKSRLYSFSCLKRLVPYIESKCIVIPNGIDNIWINNAKKRKTINLETLELLYIGRFIKRKNIINLLKATEILNMNGIKCHLALVGDGIEKNRIVNYILGKKEFSYYGKINDFNKLLELYSKSDIFTMPSSFETFGLAYIEALSQGVPVIFLKDEGISGLYGNEIGEELKSYHTNDIVKGIYSIYKNYNDYNFSPSYIASRHNWDFIAEKYISIYRENLK